MHNVCLCAGVGLTFSLGNLVNNSFAINHVIKRKRNLIITSLLLSLLLCIIRIILRMVWAMCRQSWFYNQLYKALKRIGSEKNDENPTKVG